VPGQAPGRADVRDGGARRCVRASFRNRRFGGFDHSYGDNSCNSLWLQRLQVVHINRHPLDGGVRGMPRWGLDRSALTAAYGGRDMQIQPIHTPPHSVWVTPWGPWLSQRVACWGTLQPLLGGRWQFCGGYWFSPCHSLYCFILPPVDPFDFSAPRDAVPGKPLELTWPYEIPPPPAEVVRDERAVFHWTTLPGSHLDLLT